MVWRIWGAGPALVLLHGDAGSWTHWIRNVIPLSRHVRVIVPDMPGYGDSEMPPEPWSPATLARILSSGLDTLLAGDDPVSVAGFSFGGIIAGHLAACRSQVAKLVLLGAGGMALPPSRPSVRLRRLEPGMDEAATRSVFRHNVGAMMIGDPDKVDDLAVDVQIENLRRARLRAGAVPSSDSLLLALADVRARLYGVWGERDPFAFPHIAERAETLRRFQRDIDFRVIGGAGHWTPYEAADAINAALLEFVS
ncbi:MAG: alpha/beta fold hydrolase [Acetobacteraceae bacterium]